MNCRDYDHSEELEELEDVGSGPHDCSLGRLWVAYWALNVGFYYWRFGVGSPSHPELASSYVPTAWIHVMGGCAL